VVLATEHRVQFYGSKDLLKWNHLSDFCPPDVNKDVKEWECPNLVCLPIEGSTPTTEKWVLFVAVRGRQNVLKYDYGVKYFVGKTYSKILFKTFESIVQNQHNWLD